MITKNDKGAKSKKCSLHVSFETITIMHEGILIQSAHCSVGRMNGHSNMNKEPNNGLKV